MPSWFERTLIRCPKCQYDVAQTLADGFYVCPECGSPISLDSCVRDVDTISPAARRIIYSCWAAPLFPAFLTLVDVRLAWLLAIGVGVVYGSWYWIERWLEPRGAWRRALGPTIAVLLLNALAGYALMLAVTLASQLAR